MKDELGGNMTEFAALRSKSCSKTLFLLNG